MKRYIVIFRPEPHPVLLQHLDFDGQVVSDLLVPLPLTLEVLLGPLQFGHRDGVPRTQVQLLHVDPVCVVLDPGGERSFVSELKWTSDVDNYYVAIFFLLLERFPTFPRIPSNITPHVVFMSYQMNNRTCLYSHIYDLYNLPSPFYLKLMIFLHFPECLCIVL